MVIDVFRVFTTACFVYVSGGEILAEPTGAEEIVTGFFVNTRVVVEHIRVHDPELVNYSGPGKVRALTQLM